MVKPHPPSEFDFTTPSKWPAWKSRFERYASTVELSKKDGETQVSTLLYVMGEQSESIFLTLTFAATEKKDDLATVLSKLDSYFVPKINRVHEKSIFNSATQRPDESCEGWLRRLYELVKNCGFEAAYKDTAIMDRFIVGLYDEELSQEIQLRATDDMNLAKCVEYARKFELIRAQKTERRDQAAKSVDAVLKRGRGKPSWQPQRKPGMGSRDDRGRDRDRGSGSSECQYCGLQGHNGGPNCPARNRRCNRCSKTGHYGKKCRAEHKGAREVSVEADLETSPSPPSQPLDMPHLFLGAVNTSTGPGKDWQVEVTLAFRKFLFRIDTGADVNVLTEDSFEKIRDRPVLAKSQVSLHSVASSLKCLGKFDTEIECNGCMYRDTVYVVKGAKNNLLRGELSEKLGLISRPIINEVKIQESAFGELGLMKCQPLKLQVKEGSIPYSISAPRRIPIPQIPKVKAEIQRMVDNEIVEPVSEPTEYCAPLVVVGKKDGKVRLCVDLKKLNQNLVKERHWIPAADEILPKLSGMKVFSKLDASSGFWSIPLHPDSSSLTTFLTPFGRYRFRRMPFGVTVGPEVYQKHMDNLLLDVPGVVNYIDDTLVFGRNQQEHDKNLERVVNIIQEAGLKLNKAKCEFSKSRVEFLGNIIDETGSRPSKAKVEAIREMPDPVDKESLRRFLGMVNYLGRFIPNLSTHLAPLNVLLRDDTEWIWDVDQQNAISTVKRLVTEAPTLTFYDPSRPTVVAADASSYGMGAVLLQEKDGRLLPVELAACTLNDSEKRYAQIEKECLAATFAVERFDKYLMGLDHFKLLSDHKPLIPLMNTKDLDKTPIRCQRMLMRLRKYNFVAEHVPGKDLVVADALSRAPQAKRTKADDQLAREIEQYVNSVEQEWPVSSNKLRIIREATASDEVLRNVMSYTYHGWPSADLVDDSLSKYFECRNRLSVRDGIVLYDRRIAVPYALRSEMLMRIHDGHLGVSKSRERAKQAIWWPGMSTEIKQTVAECEFCQERLPAQKSEPLLTTPLPDRPWQRVGADVLFHKNLSYLVVTDYYSRYIELAYLPDQRSSTLIFKVKSIFARFGIPDQLVSDNAGNFAAQQFAGFAQDYGFDHVFVSARYPQANGAAERAVQSAKFILDQDDPFKALLVYRSTPIQATGYSPAQLLIGRQIRSTLPMIDENLQFDSPKFENVKQNDVETKRNYAKFYDRRHSAAPLRPLKVGDEVRVKTDVDKNWNTTGIVKTVPTESNPRSYEILAKGRILKRNRKHLKTDTAVPSLDPITNFSNPNSDNLKSSETVVDPVLNPVPIVTPPEPVQTPDVVDPVIRTRSGRISKAPNRFGYN